MNSGPAARSAADPSRNSLTAETLAEPSSRAAHPSAAPGDELPCGAAIGRYVVLNKLGAGGMGVVYAAYDPELDRKVAIKLLHSEANDGQASQGKARLLREAQAMARLAHPNVVAVYDVGTLGERVFLAMEFIDGCTLTAWLQAQPRRRDEILEKFTAAGRGLIAAHTAGLVHRDFKPDNVLIGRDGRARVTDFGIARSIERPGAPASGTPSPERAVEALVGPDGQAQALGLPLTRHGALLGTPRYMAPEQFRSAAVDARTDQFSFCVALYEALHGVEPFSGDTLASRCLSVITGQMNPLPLEAQRRAPGWLRQVVLRGLKLSPDERYPSMEALLAALGRDVERQRLRILGAAAVLVLVAFAGGLIARGLRRGPGSLCRGQAERLVGIWDQERKRAVKQVLLASGRAYGEEAWQRLEPRLDAYVRDWSAAQVEACQATYVRGVQSQGVLDLRMRCLDRRLYEVAALTGQLLEADEAALEQASGASNDLTPLGTCADVAALSAPVPLPESPQTRAVVDRLHQELAALRAAERVGRYSKVMPQARKVVEDARRVGYPPALADALVLLAELEIQSSERPAAEQALFQAAAAAVSGRDHARAARIWTLLMFVAGNRKDYTAAERWQALANAELDLTSEADDIKGQLFNNLCAINLFKRAYSEALAACDQAIVHRSRYYGADHSLVAAVMSNKSIVYKNMGQIDQALELAQKAYQMQAQALGPLNPRLGDALAALANLYRIRENYAEADATYHKTIELYRKSYGEINRKTSSVLFSLATSKLAQKQFAEALEVGQRLLALRNKIFGPDSAEVASAMHVIGRVSFLQKRYAEAMLHFQSALAIYEKKHADDGVGLELMALANCLSGLGRPKAALPLIERAERLRNDSSPQDRLADLQFARARALWARSRKERSQVLKLTSSAIEAYKKLGPTSRSDLEAVTVWLREQNLP